jgi:hypothetical protein
MIANKPHPRESELGGFHPEVLLHHIAEFKRHSKIGNQSQNELGQYRYRIKRFREYLRWRRDGWIDDQGKPTR